MPRVYPGIMILGGLAVLTLWALFLALGYAGTIALRIPLREGFPTAIRLLGALLVLSSFILFAWLFKYRRPLDVLISTYVTFSKMAKRTSLHERFLRTEPLVVAGPYRYVRHPLYAGVVLLVLGLWMALDYTSLLVTAVLFLLWFNSVVAPFEEKELRAIFGNEYEEYAKRVGRMFPLPRRSNRD